MVSCLTSTTTDPLPQSPSIPATNRHSRPEARDALSLLHRSKTPKHLKHLHARILRSGLSDHPAVAAALTRLYAAHRLPSSAARFLAAPQKLPHPPPTLVWNLLVRALALNGHPLHSLLLYNRLISLALPPDKFTFPFAVAACSRCAHHPKGKEIHAAAVKSGFYNDPFLQNALIHFYFACRDIISARKLFDKMRARTVVSWTSLVSGLVSCGELDAARAAFEAMPARNVVAWTAMIDGCARNGRPDEAFQLLHRMLRANVRPNEFTIVGLLIACTELTSLSLGRWVHNFARESGGLDSGVFVGTALVDMYSKCGSLEDAVEVFDRLPVRSLATWNSMITSLGVHGQGKRAIELFGEMERTGVRPDGITFVGVLCACARERMVDEGLAVFRRMRERYGIGAGVEHYRCLVELLGCDDGLERAREMVKGLAMELDGDGDGFSKTLKKGSDEFTSRTEQCYEWEVG